jgi:DNA-binding NtrC family response regulator
MTSGRRTVLVIDDEESVREVLNRLLTKAGYEVKIARASRYWARRVRK